MSHFLLLLIVLPTLLFGEVELIHPVKQIKSWYTEERQLSERPFHQLATLATVSSDGSPHTRLIDLVHIHQKKGFLFFTHKNTSKVDHFSVNPLAAVNIFLPKTLKQASMEGKVELIDLEEAEKWWKKMPRYMKLTFSVSDHLSPIGTLDELSEKKQALAKAYPDELPMPDSFIGYRFVPEKVILYQVVPRDFAIKHIAELKEDQWVVTQVQP